MANFRSLTIQSGITTQIQDSNTLVVGNGITTLSGDLTLSATGNLLVASGKNFSAVGGSSLFDFSAASGLFKTTTGAVTVGPGAVTVSGATTFTAAGTALTVDNNSTFTGTTAFTGAATHTGAIFANGGLDRSTAAALNLGITNANAVNIGKIGAVTTVKGDFQVDGNETIIGTSTFTDDVAFEGDITFGNAPVDTVTFTARTVGDFHFLKETDHVIDVDASTTTDTAGSNLTIKSADGYGNANGGNLVVRAGAKAGTGTNGILSLGTTSTSAIALGASGVTTTVTGGLTQLTGAVSLTGNGASSFTTSSGALTLTSAAAATWSTGAGALTLNGAGGLNLQNAGTTVLALTGTTAVVQAGVTLSVTGSGNINLPNNGTSRFQIEGVSVGSTVTAANLNTLTNGSDATGLHYHTDVGSAGNVALSGLTTTGVTTGFVGYVSANNTILKAKADSMSTAKVVGVNSGTAGELEVAGAVDAQFVAGLTLAAGDFVYLSAATAGQLTNVAPTTDGQVVLKVGVVLNTTAYTGTAGDLANIVLQVGTPVQL